MTADSPSDYRRKMMMTVHCTRILHARIALIAILVCLPLLISLAVLALSLAERILQPLLPVEPTSQAPSTQLSQEQTHAAAVAKQYCARLTGATCTIDPTEVTVLTPHLLGRERQRSELSAAAAERYARLYLARAGIVLPCRTRLVRGTDGIYRLDHEGVGGATHVLGVCGVCIDPTDGRLLLLADRPAPANP
jgi:hypothetical protein